MAYGGHAPCKVNAKNERCREIPKQGTCALRLLFLVVNGRIFGFKKATGKKERKTRTFLLCWSVVHIEMWIMSLWHAGPHQACTQWPRLLPCFVVQRGDFLHVQEDVHGRLQQRQNWLVGLLSTAGVSKPSTPGLLDPQQVCKRGNLSRYSL